MITWLIAFLVFSFLLGWINRQTARPWKLRDWRIRLIHLQILVAGCAYFLAIVKAGRGQEGLLITIAALFLVGLFLRVWVREVRRLIALSDDSFRGRSGRIYWVVILIVFAPIGVWMFRSSYPAELLSATHSQQ